MQTPRKHGSRILGCGCSLTGAPVKAWDLVPESDKHCTVYYESSEAVTACNQAESEPAPGARLKALIRDRQSGRFTLLPYDGRARSRSLLQALITWCGRAPRQQVVIVKLYSFFFSLLYFLEKQ